MGDNVRPERRLAGGLPGGGRGAAGGLPGSLVETPAGLRALREHAGMSQWELARSLGLATAAKVAEWEREGGEDAPREAWEALLGLDAWCSDMAEAWAGGVLSAMAELPEGTEVPPVVVARYTGQEQWARHDPEAAAKIPWGAVNRALMGAAVLLMEAGADVEVADADDPRAPIGA